MSYEISTDPRRLDRDQIHAFLSLESYWARGRAREVTERAIDGSLCFGAYDGDGAMAGFARAVTDRATFAYLCDVFVSVPHRGRGLGVQLVRATLEHPDLAGVRWVLATEDAQGLYERFGFAGADPVRFLVRERP